MSDTPRIRRSESPIQTPAGDWLFHRSWLPAPEPGPDSPSVDPERLVLLVHGLGEHSGRYEAVASWLAARGCAVHAYDHRGHGRSEGPRGHVASFDDYLDDLEVLVGLVQRESPGLPTFLIGQSMGGLMVSAFLRERQPRLAGAIVTGSALELPVRLSGLRRLAVRALRLVAPRLSFPAGIDPDGLSRDPEVGRRYLADPLVETRITVSLAAEIADRIEPTVAGAAEIAVPMFVLHGQGDPICLPSGSEALAGALVAPGSELKLYPRLRHEVFHEAEREAVLEDILAWVKKRRD